MKYSSFLHYKQIYIILHVIYIVFQNAQEKGIESLLLLLILSGEILKKRSECQEVWFYFFTNHVDKTKF